MKSKQDLIANLDTFTHAYIECALWSSMDNADDSGGEPLDRNYDIDSLARETLTEMVADCVAFQADNKALLEGIDDEQAGYDFWLTRNHHGTGFWDRGLGEIGDKLTDASHAWGSVDLYVHRKRIYA